MPFMSNKIKLPSVQDILGFLKLMEGQPVSKRELARAFGIKGADARVALKKLLNSMVEDGLVEPCKSKAVRLPQKEGDTTAPHLPLTEDLRIVDINAEGELFCETVDHKKKGFYPLIILENRADVEEGAVVTATLTETAPGEYQAKVIKKHPKEEDPHLMGVFKQKGEEGIVQPLARDLQSIDFYLPAPIPKELKTGNVVLVKPVLREQNVTRVELVEIVSQSIKGNEAAIAIEDFGIPHVFPQEVIKESEELPAFNSQKLNGREDLRKIPMVTIDGADAKDFDDAVWAESWETDQHGKGHHIIVAIADVAHYIRQNSPLDKEALERGNSVYFPGFVVPMLPERLCNDLCSLRPNEDRPVLAVHMYIGADGKLKKHKFVRGVIHSHARLIYEQVQQAFDGKPDELTSPLLECTLKPLLAAYKTLIKARDARGALDLDMPEKFIQFHLDENGKETPEIDQIKKRERLDAHRLIEEMMVLANVAAATALQTIGAPCMYRIHPQPGDNKLDGLKTALKGVGLKFNPPSSLHPKSFAGIIQKVRNRDDSATLMQVLLRSQEQARYDPENIGHFGLALERYAHFTSPIRRYSDLIVHRSLIEYLGLAGEGGVKSDNKRLNTTAEHLCITERRAQKAEWSTRDRITVRFYRDFVGNTFKATVVTVTKFGMFVSIEDGLAEGLIPLRWMDDDRYGFNYKTETLHGKFTKKSYGVGQKIDVTLIEADIVVGRLTFALGADRDPNGEPERLSHPKRTKAKRTSRLKNTDKKRTNRRKRR
jgi:ribonuclease R